ncbi:hypothetical protein ACIGXF_38305 [Streptomyces sp. NPDC053086]|uniref:hypothetical protein n=1 Tax=unclassified Streptomyces TaxID=2593676 RepID=UPI0036F83FCA
MTSSSDEAVYRKAAADLARMTLPDLSVFPTPQTEVAMAKAFRMNGPREDWLDEFRSRIRHDSGERVVMEDADRATFPPPLDKSPAASYQRLVDTRTSAVQLLVMGPFSPPFRFVPGAQPGSPGTPD